MPFPVTSSPFSKARSAASTPPTTAQLTPARGLTTQARKRRLVALDAVGDVLENVPEAGETLHALMTGLYDLMHLLVVLVRKVGKVEVMRIATLGLSSRNVAEMARMLDEGQVGRLAVLVNGFFARNCRDIFEELLLEVRGRGHKVAQYHSHCKLVCLHLADGRKFLLEGSANLRTNKSIEQFALTQDAALHDWYAAWLDTVIGTHETRGESNQD